MTARPLPVCVRWCVTQILHTIQRPRVHAEVVRTTKRRPSTPSGGNVYSVMVRRSFHTAHAVFPRSRNKEWPRNSVLCGHPYPSWRVITSVHYDRLFNRNTIPFFFLTIYNFPSFTGGSSRLEKTPDQQYVTSGHLVSAPGSKCNGIWTTWPVIQENGLTGHNVLVFRIFPSVGNLFIVLESAISVNERFYKPEHWWTTYMISHPVKRKHGNVPLFWLWFKYVNSKVCVGSLRFRIDPLLFLDSKQSKRSCHPGEYYKGLRHIENASNISYFDDCW